MKATINGWITTDDTYSETWKRILEFANIELAIEKIEQIHGKTSTSSMKHYKKQAEQIRGSLLQAKEYFEAAKSSSLYTKPNHLYYGAVSLSIACMLIRGDGEKSLDYLRRDKKNKHHGLDYSLSISPKTAKKGMELLSSCMVKICPYGHFANWYKTLRPRQNVYADFRKKKGKHTSKILSAVGQYTLPEYEKLMNSNNSIEFRIKRLPDLVEALHRFGIITNTAKGRHLVDENLNVKQHQHVFTFNDAPSHEILMRVVDRFVSKSGVAYCYDIEDGSTHGGVLTRISKGMQLGFPSHRETLDHQSIYYEEPITIPEVVDMYIISYALIMLSRYYPDIWMSFIESHCKGAKVIEDVVDVTFKKLPILMLNQMTGRDYIISTHRPYWL